MAMSEFQGQAEGRRQELLEKLRRFEEAAEKIRYEGAAREMTERIARFRQAIQELRAHLSRHLATRETAQWPALPDSDAEISAFAAELKAEHRELIDELLQLARAADEIERAADRTEAAARIREQSRALALRIARHAGEEEAPLGNYS